MDNPFEMILEQLAQMRREISELKFKTEAEVETDQFLTVQEAADYLSLSVATIYTKKCHKEIPFFKKGKRLYFLKSQLDNWIQSGRPTLKNDDRQAVDKHLMGVKRR